MRSTVRPRLLSTALGIMLAAPIASGPVHATPDAEAQIEAAPCAAFDPELYSGQRWVPGARPYGIAIEHWDRSTFEALRRRLTACITPANRARTTMVLRYLDDPYGPVAQVTRQLDAAQTAATRTAALTEEIRADLAALANEPDLVQRRGRLSRVTTKLDTSRLPVEEQQALRAELSRQTVVLTSAEAAQVQARQAAEHERRAAEARAADAARQAAARDSADRQAAETQRQTQLQAEEQAAAAAAEKAYAERLPRLSPALITLFNRNPALKPITARDSLLEAKAVVDSYVVALDTCRATLGGFASAWTEVQRRLGLMQQALLTYYDVPAPELAQITRFWRVRWQNQGLAARLQADHDLMQQTCDAALPTTAGLLDFAR